MKIYFRSKVRKYTARKTMCHGYYRTYVQLSQEAKNENRDQVNREQAMGDEVEKENAVRNGARGRGITAGMEGGRTLARN
jgi:hypothetical protein